MNLTNLFKTQAALDEHIMQEHPELRGQNNLDWKLLALQVELGECANEWRGFKKWSKDQEPRTSVICLCATCQGTGDENYETVTEDAESGCKHEFMKCEECNGTGEIGYRNPLLEEYVDCLHFILSIGLEIGYENFSNEIRNEYKKSSFGNRKNSITELFINLNWLVGCIYDNEIHYEQTLFELIGLSEMLGFTWDEVEAAYYTKNKVNHERQNAGY